MMTGGMSSSPGILLKKEKNSSLDLAQHLSQFYRGGLWHGASVLQTLTTKYILKSLPHVP